MKPKKILRRQKKNYPMKRDNYKNYKNAKWKWINVFLEIEKLKMENIHSYIKIISDKYNIKYSTLKNKYNKWKVNKPDIIEDNRGINNRFFKEEEELELYNLIKDKYIDVYKFLDDSCLNIIAIEYWNSKYPDKVDLFKASNGWIYDFKLRWGLSSLTPSSSRKSTEKDNNRLNEFTIICIAIKHTIEESLIFNMDETFWRYILGNQKVIGITGSENRKLITNANIKSGFTSIFIIAANGLFVTPIIILKGKTKRCLKKIDSIDDSLIFKKYSEHGWITVEIMKFVLQLIYKISKNKNSILLLDEYSVHTDNEIKKEANKLSIQLIFIPPGKTATHQPLDVNINGAIKSIGKKLDKKKLISNPDLKPNIANSIKTLIESKEKIKRETIVNSFKKANIL